jgi:hypothetical protein
VSFVRVCVQFSVRLRERGNPCGETAKLCVLCATEIRILPI